MKTFKILLIAIAIFSSFMTVKTFSYSFQREEFSSRTKSYRAKIKTKTNGIIGNISVNATDSCNAEFKIKQKYPGCTILSLKEI